MGQKINPTGFRLPVTHDWTSRWYATGRDFARTLAEDLKVRDYPVSYTHLTLPTKA